MFERASDLDGFFGQRTYAKKYGHEIWYLECKKPV
jgi:hypothetical protein